MAKIDSLEYLEELLKEAEKVLEVAAKSYADAITAVIRLKVQKDIVFISTGRMLGNDGLLIDTIMSMKEKKVI